MSTDSAKNHRAVSKVLVAVSVVIVAVLLIGAAVYDSGYFASPSHTSITNSTSTTSPTSTTTSSTLPATTDSTVSPSGIRLAATLNDSTISAGQSLNVSISIFNTLSTVNTVLPSEDWSFQGIGTAMWGSCVGVYPVETVVLSGNYTVQELPSVANSTFPYLCAGYISVNQVIFQPSSGQANITGTGPGPSVNQTLGPFHLTTSFTTSGYWNLQSLLQQLNPPIIGAEGRAPNSMAFVPGIYTIAAEDEWGQVVLIHATVVPGTSPQTSDFVACAQTTWGGVDVVSISVSGNQTYTTLMFSYSQVLGISTVTITTGVTGTIGQTTSGNYYPECTYVAGSTG